MRVARGLFIALVLLVSPAPAPALARPGELDLAFGDGGTSQLPRGTRLRAAAVQPDGKLIAVGEMRSGADAPRLLIARFTRGGDLDPTFGDRSGIEGLLGLLGLGGGTFVGAANTTANAVAIQPNGRIVVGGARGGGATAGMLVMRLGPDGSPDPSFAGDGIATALSGRGAQALSVAVHRGKIVLGGSATLPGRTADDFPRVAVARLRADGSPDRGFGRRGAAVLDFGRLSYVNALAVRRDGRIVIAGSVRHDLRSTAVLAGRLTAAGRPDRSFGGNVGVPGLFVRQYARRAAYSAAFDLALARGGKVVLGGVALDAARGSDALAVRLTSRGSPDRSFSGNGAVHLRAAVDRDQFTRAEPYPGAHGMELDAGRILLAGYRDQLGRKQLALWALGGNGAPVRGFGSGGHSFTSLGRASAELADLTISPGGGLYGVGEVLASPTERPSGLAARYGGFG